MRRFLALSLLLFFATSVHAQTALDWQMLHEVDYVQNDENRWVLEFSERMQNLNGEVVTIDGFIIPLEQSMEQKHFILSSSPLASCQFCMPGDTSVYIEVQANEGFSFSYDPVIVKGKLELLENDPNGLIYRITEATPL